MKFKLIFFISFFALLVSSGSAKASLDFANLPHSLPYSYGGYSYDKVYFYNTGYASCIAVYIDSTRTVVFSPRMYPEATYYSMTHSYSNLYSRGFISNNCSFDNWLGYSTWDKSNSTGTTSVFKLLYSYSGSLNDIWLTDFNVVARDSGSNFTPIFGINPSTGNQILFPSNTVPIPEPPNSDEDPFQNIDYAGEENFYLNYYSPRPDSGYINEDLNAIDITVKPNATFSTYWFAEYDPNQQNYIIIDTCDVNWENCTFTLEVIENFITAQSDNHLMIPFVVVDTETEYYKITLKNEDNTKRATIPIKITGDVNSTYDSIAPYIPEESQNSDWGFFGNLLRNLFLPDADYWSLKLSQINQLRLEKFVWYFQIKDELNTGITTLSSASGVAPVINLNMFGSGNVNVFDVSYIDSYMATFKTWMSAFLWVVFGIFIIKKSSSILKS